MAGLYAILVGDGYLAIGVRLALGAVMGFAVYKGYLTQEQAAQIQDAALNALPWYVTGAGAGILEFILSALNKRIDTENKIVRPASQGGRKSSFPAVRPSEVE